MGGSWRQERSPGSDAFRDRGPAGFHCCGRGGWTLGRAPGQTDDGPRRGAGMIWGKQSRAPF